MPKPTIKNASELARIKLMILQETGQSGLEEALGIVAKRSSMTHSAHEIEHNRLRSTLNRILDRDSQNHHWLVWMLPLKLAQPFVVQTIYENDPGALLSLAEQ